MSAQEKAGVFGKIRAQGDFLRVNASGPAALALVRWMEDCNEALHRASTVLSAEPLRFVFPDSRGEQVLIGALAPGRDKVDRAFPLAVFTWSPAAALGAKFPLVPAIYRGFLDAAATLVSEAPGLAPAVLTQRLRLLPLPDPADTASAEEWSQRAGAEKSVAALQRLFGEAADGQRYYAFSTFEGACRNARGGAPGRPNIALDCPCTVEGDVWAWLELTRRALAWPSPPPFFWRTGTAPALVISLGAPPAGLLLLFAQAARESQKIWPLKTRQRPAVDQAQRSLPPAHLAAIDRQDLTVRELVDSLFPS